MPPNLCRANDGLTSVERKELMRKKTALNGGGIRCTIGAGGKGGTAPSATRMRVDLWVYR